MPITQNYGVIVDPVSIGALFSPAFGSHGVKSIAVRSPGYSPGSNALFDASQFERVIDHTGDVEQTLAQLLPAERIGFVVAGSHYGLRLADQLADRLHLPNSNSIAHSRARHDKFELIETLARAGISRPDQLLTNDPEEAVRWVRSGCGYPAVVKPRASAGTDMVTICSDEAALRRGFSQIMANPDLYKKRNEHVVVQSYATGQEYAVDSVSWNGKHQFLCMWKATRDKGPHPFAYVQELVAQDCEHFALLSRYVAEVLDACGYRQGAAHTEVIVDANNVPRIIELNARCHGTLDQFLPTAAIGTNQVLEVARAYCSPNPGEFWPAARTKSAAALKVTLVSTIDGTVENEPPWSIFEDLESFCSSHQRVKKGGSIRTTRDMPSAPGVIFLQSQDEDKVWRDYELLRELEKKFYASLKLSSGA